MKTFKLLFVSAIFGMGATVAAQDSVDSSRPDIILLISDDQRWDGLGIAGNDVIKTPNLDRMAREGQWYREATIQIPLCAPSRAAMLTGMPPSENGYYSNNHQRADVRQAHGFDQYEVLPDVLRKAGYDTAFVGKWHLIPDPWLCGFETVKHWMLPGAGPYRGPRLANGKSRETEKVEGFTQTIFADDALEVLNEKAEGNTTEPLFMWVAFTAPHLAFIPNPEPIAGMYKGKSAEELAPKTFYDDPQKARHGDKDWQDYYEAITAVDAQVGRIMDKVRDSSLSTNTLVVFIGDNGFMMGRRGQWGKSVPYEDSLRVPLIVWGPDNVMEAKGTTVTASANSLDLPVTFAKLAGADVPEKWVGRDLSPVIRDGKNHGIDWAVSQFPDHGTVRGQTAAYRTIRTPKHKLIVWHPMGDKKPELYDLVKDPAENTNLYGDPTVADVQARLEKQLAEFRTKAGDDQWDMKGNVLSFRESGSYDGQKQEEQPKKEGKRKGRRNKQQ